MDDSHTLFQVAALKTLPSDMLDRLGLIRRFFAHGKHMASQLSTPDNRVPAQGPYGLEMR